MSDQRKKAAPKRGDLYLMVGCLLAALVCCCLWFLLRQDGGTVIVEQNGQETARYALSEDRTVRIGRERSATRARASSACPTSWRCGSREGRPG